MTIIAAMSSSVSAEMERHPSSHAKPIAEAGHKMETLEAKVDGFDVSFDIMTHKAYQDMMTKMKMDFMKPASGTTHHIAVTIRKEGQKVEDAKVEAKVVAPDGTEVTKKLPYNPDMMYQYVGHFHMAQKGKYQVLVTFEIGKERHQGKVVYEVR
jgi:hypothetical protein